MSALQLPLSDPTASAPEALHEYGIQLAALEEMHQLDGAGVRYWSL